MAGVGEAECEKECLLREFVYDDDDSLMAGVV